MAFKMKGSYHYGKNPLKQKALGPHKPKRDGSQDLKPIGTYKPKPGDPKGPTPKSSSPTKMDPTMIMMVADKLGKSKDKEGSKGLDISPMPQKKEESYYEKMQKRDWDAGSTLEKGDYATYGQQAYDKKGNKTSFENFEQTGRVKVDDKGRPYTYHGSEKIYLSSADEEGRPQSPAKQTKSGKGNIFTRKGRNQRNVNKINRIAEEAEASRLGQLKKYKLPHTHPNQPENRNNPEYKKAYSDPKYKKKQKKLRESYDKTQDRLYKRLKKGDDPNKKGLQIGGEDHYLSTPIGGGVNWKIKKGRDMTHEDY